MDRSYIFMSEIGISLAMEFTPENTESLKFAIAFCNKKDNFNRKTARGILDKRLEKEASTYLRSTAFEGDKPRKDVLIPFANALGDYVQENVIIRLKSGDEIRGFLCENPNGDTVIRRGRDTITIDTGNIDSITTTSCRRNVDNVLEAFQQVNINQEQEDLVVV
tara:strand:- start:111434 stop:111925 length:492 start_codon:yes stop_codon:yes gene_type:complete